MLSPSYLLKLSCQPQSENSRAKGTKYTCVQLLQYTARGINCCLFFWQTGRTQSWIFFFRNSKTSMFCKGGMFFGIGYIIFFSSFSKYMWQTYSHEHWCSLYGKMLHFSQWLKKIRFSFTTYQWGWGRQQWKPKV